MSTDTRPPARGGARLAASGAAAATRASLLTGPRRRDGRGVLFRALLLLGLGLALTALAAIVTWAILDGAPRFDLTLFTEGPSTIDPSSAGFRTAILGTVYVIGGVILLIVPLGVGSAIYLEHFADSTRWWNRLIDVNIQNLAAVPSIVFGILGLAFVVRGPFGIGFNPAAGSITLAMLVLPTVIIAAREALRAVPSSIRDGSLALGATDLQTIRRQVLPVARPGILTGIILAVARAVGEAAPLLLVGAVTFATRDPEMFRSGYATMPTMIYQFFQRPQEEFKLLAAAGAIVMLLIVLVMNSAAVWLRNRFEKELRP